MSNWRIIACSSPDHEDLVAEIFRDEDFIALVDQEDGVDDLKIEWSPDIGKFGRLPLVELENAINQARSRLKELRRSPPTSAP